MTDEQYNRLVYLRGKHHTICHHPCGSDCTAFKKGRCIALTNTLFRYNKPCPFFKKSEVIPMYDELIERLRNCLTEVNCTGCDCNNSLIKQAADAIDDLENRLNLWRQDKIRRWIPVTERLPKENGFYLCLYKHKASGGVAMDEGLSILQWINNKWGINDIYLVTHWMPLPEPPESDGE